MKILIAGDYSPKDRVTLKIQNGDTNDLFSSVYDTIHSVDYAIVNFESVVVEGEAKPIEKCGPCLKCQPEAVSALKEAGFQCLTLANNHFRDFGEEGVLTSLRCFKDNDIDYVGGGENIVEAEAILYKRFADGKLAIINVCENEFSIANPTRAGSAPLDTVEVYHRILEARKQADYVLVIIHGGHEHYQLPSPRMKQLYRFFVEVGADAVVNHHQHCYSGYEIFNGKPIVYGLGNFLFDDPKKRDSIWNEGFMAILAFSQSGVLFKAIPYVQCNEEPNVCLMQDGKNLQFEERIKLLNSIITDDEKLNEKMKEFILFRKRSIMSVFTPYTNKFVRAAASHHWIPYLLPKSKVLDMIDYISCESQRDITLGYLEVFSKSK